MLTDDNKYLHRELFHLSGEDIVGVDGGLREVMDMVRHVAPLDSHVLLRGETGSAKTSSPTRYTIPRPGGRAPSSG